MEQASTQERGFALAPALQQGLMRKSSASSECQCKFT